jgi:hypothetical protein
MIIIDNLDALIRGINFAIFLNSKFYLKNFKPSPNHLQTQYKGRHDTTNYSIYSIYHTMQKTRYHLCDHTIKVVQQRLHYLLIILSQTHFQEYEHRQQQQQQGSF